MYLLTRSSNCLTALLVSCAMTLRACTAWLEVLAAILFFFVDHALASAILLLGGLFASRRLELMPWRIVAQGGLIVFLAILAAAGSTPLSLVLLLAIACTTLSIPAELRGCVQVCRGKNKQAANKIFFMAVYEE